MAHRDDHIQQLACAAVAELLASGVARCCRRGGIGMWWGVSVVGSCHSCWSLLPGSRQLLPLHLLPLPLLPHGCVGYWMA